MSTGLLAPIPRTQWLLNDGSVNAGGSIETYLAGTSTPVNTYSDSGLSSSNGTVMTLNSAGRPEVAATEVAIYLSSAVSYKFVMKDANGVPIWTQDQVSVAAGSSNPVVPAPSAPNQVIRTTDGSNWTASDSPTLQALTTVGNIAVGGALAVTGAVTLSTKLGLASGGTNADLSATGGTKQFVKQSSTGAALTVGTIATADIASAMAGIIGAGVSKSVNTVYTAATSGLLVVTIIADAGTAATATVLSDSSNPPTTAVGYISGQSTNDPGGAGVIIMPNNTCTIPIVSGKNYKVTTTSTAGGPTLDMTFYPLGS